MIKIGHPKMVEVWRRQGIAQFERAGHFLSLINSRFKPRLKFQKGLWVCSIPGEMDLGFGRSPAEAYDHWNHLVAVDIVGAEQ